MTWWDRVKKLEQLGFLDESEPYEVDQTGVFFDPKTNKYVLLTASGCSCWDGDFEEEQFDTLNELEESLMDGRQRQYNPALENVKTLMDEVRENARKLYK